jgi:putative FmdB family regulatory protein
MAEFSYVCAKCGNRFDASRRRPERNAPIACRNCGSPAKRCFSSFNITRRRGAEDGGRGSGDGGGLTAELTPQTMEQLQRGHLGAINRGRNNRFINCEFSGPGVGVWNLPGGELKITGTDFKGNSIAVVNQGEVEVDEGDIR